MWRGQGVCRQCTGQCERRRGFAHQVFVNATRLCPRSTGSHKNHHANTREHKTQLTFGARSHAVEICIAAYRYSSGTMWLGQGV